MCFQERFREVFSSFIIYDIQALTDRKMRFLMRFQKTPVFYPKTKPQSTPNRGSVHTQQTLRLEQMKHLFSLIN